MFSRVIFQRIIMMLILLIALALFGVVAFRYQTTDIPVLTVKVAAGSVIEPGKIRNLSWPSNAIFPGMIASSDQMAGKVAAVNLDPGVPVSRNQLSDEPLEHKDPRYPAADNVDLLKLKYFIPTDLRRSSGMVILPGDYVDVVVSSAKDRTGLIILQKVHIIGARTSTGQNTTGLPATNGPAVAVGGGTKTTLLIAGYLLALTPDQVSLIARYDYQTIVLVPTSLDAPDIPNVPSGLDVNSGGSGPDGSSTQP